MASFLATSWRGLDAAMSPTILLGCHRQSWARLRANGSVTVPGCTYPMLTVSGSTGSPFGLSNHIKRCYRRTAKLLGKDAYLYTRHLRCQN